MLATLKSSKADVSSVSPSSGRLEELWVVCGFICRKWSYPFGGVWWREKKNKLVEWKALVDTVGIKSADVEDKFCSSVLQLSELLRWRERPQTAICCLEWLGRYFGTLPQSKIKIRYVWNNIESRKINKQVDKQPLSKMKPSRWMNICLEESSCVG